MRYLKETSFFIIITIAFILLGCSKQSSQPMDLIKFLPFESNATKYIYKTTTVNNIPSSGKIKSKETITEKIVTLKKNNCISVDTYWLFDQHEIFQLPANMKQYIKNNRKKGISEQLCVAKDKIYFYDSPTLYQQKNDWTMKVQSVTSDGKKQTIDARCSFISLSNKIIFDKTRKIIHTQCRYDIKKDNTNTIDWFIAENLGLYQIIMRMDDKSTNSHGITTTTMIQYE